VINVQGEHASPPRSIHSTLDTEVGASDLPECATEIGGSDAIGPFLHTPEEVLRRSTVLMLALVVPLSREVTGIQTKLLYASADVEVRSTCGNHAKHAHDSRYRN